MQILVNSQPVTLEAPLSLELLLQQLNQQPNGMALAVNQKIISRSEWADHTVADGDNITLIRATAGG